MTIKDRKAIKQLYFFNNYLPSSIARLYGLSHVRVLKIINEDEDKHITFTTGLSCLLCSNEDDAIPFYIDGNENNNKPQNVVMLCEGDRRRIRALQLRRKEKLVLKPQY